MLVNTKITMNRAIESEKLTRATFRRAVKYLCDRDPDLARVIVDYGHPPMWLRKPGFSTLVYIILGQQISLASARATFDRLREAARPLTPYRFLTLDDTALHDIGFSRQKTYYCRQLSLSIRQKELKLFELENMDNKTARSELTKIKGIGPWTADIYLLMALRRPDIWPSTDLAIAVATQKLKKIPVRPGVDKLNEISNLWRPWRSVAARVLWHYYLSR